MKIHKNEISVIIPMYNSKETIIPVLDAINNQSHIEYIKEIIVVNDGSTDGSPKLVEQYHSKIPIVLVHQSNSGVSKARNTAMALASGSWIAFCDSDDVWIKNKIAIQVNVVNKLSDSIDIDFVGGNHTDKDLKILFKTISTIHRASVPELCIKMYPQTSTVLMKKSIYKTIGGFDVKQRYAEDGNYFLRIVSQYKCYYIPRKLVVYDSGKRGFGASGLSSNLKEMHKGSLKNLRELKENHSISYFFYLIMVAFYELKYFRRIMICKFNK